MLQMLRERLFLLLKLVQAQQGMSLGSLLRWGCFCGCSQRGAALCPCLHSPEEGISPLHPSILWDPQGCRCIPPILSPARHPSMAPRKPHCSAPRGQPLGHWGPITSPGACVGSGSQRMGVTETVPHCRSWYSLWLQSRRAYPQEVIEKERGCLQVCLVLCHARGELVAPV